MKKTLKILLPILIICIVGSAYYNLTKPTKINSFIASKIYKTPANKAFTDENFYKCVVDAYNDRNGTSVAYTTNLTDEQLATINNLNCYGFYKSDEEKVISVNGLEKLVNITKLYLTDNLITNIDLSKNTKLTDLRLSGNQLTTLDVSQNTELTHLEAKNNQLINLDVSNNTELVELFVPKNQLNSLDISNNITIRELDVSENQLTNLEVTNIVYLDVSENQLTTLNLENNPKLSSIDAHNNKLTNIDVSNNTSLTSLHVYNNQLTNINVSKNASLKTLRAKNNRLTNVDASNNTELTYLDVSENQLTNIDVSKNVKLTELFVYNNQLTSIDVSNNTELTYLNVGNNQLTTIDVSNDTSLKYLIIISNPFIENKGIYKNDTFDNTNSIVKLPKDKESILTTILQNHGPRDKVDTSNQGNYQYDLTFKHTIGDNTGSIYHVKLNLYVIESTSNKYDINAEEGYIYTTTDTDEETILSNINLNYGEASIENNKLLIKYDGELIKSFDVVNVSSSKYDLSKNYIYLGTNDLSLEDINVTNGEKFAEDSKLKIKYNDNILKEYDLIKISSEKYDLTKGYIFDNDFNVDNITLTNGTKEVEGNKLLIKYDGELLQSYDIVSVNSNKYDLNKNYIYTGTSDLDLNDINVTNGQKSIEDNKLLIKYNDDLLREYAIYNINFREYEAYDGLLVLPENTTYEELINNIITNGVTYKIFSGETEITEGNISEGMTVKIYYGDEAIDEYEVTNEYLELDESLNIDNGVNIIEKLPRNLKLKDFISLINTSGSIEVRNNNALLSDDSVIGTGSKLKITLSNRVVEYTLSVRGDVTGNGQAKMADVMKIATHIIEGNIISGDAFERAADITGDGKIKMNDVMKLATFIIDGGEL